MLKSVVGQITRMGNLFGLSQQETEIRKNRDAASAAQEYHETFRQLFGTTASADPLYRHKRCPKGRAQ